MCVKVMMRMSYWVGTFFIVLICLISASMGLRTPLRNKHRDDSSGRTEISSVGPTNTVPRVSNKKVTLLTDVQPIFKRTDEFLEGRREDLFRYADLSNVDLTKRDDSFYAALFLASNVPYLLVGIQQGGTEGALLNIAGVVSFVYHYFQLTLGPNTIEVRRCLLVDYITAVNACVIYGIDAFDIIAAFRSPEAGAVFLIGSAGLLTLWRSAIVDQNGKKYIFWHSLWHLCGALTAYLVN